MKKFVFLLTGLIVFAVSPVIANGNAELVEVDCIDWATDVADHWEELQDEPVSHSEYNDVWYEQFDWCKDQQVGSN